VRTKDRGSPYADVMRLTSDVSLLHDPDFFQIATNFAADQSKLDEAFAQAWDQVINAGAVFSRAKRCTMDSSVIV